jgi:ribose/xylose/arabinose/galactoside ABC-type transport system permease subunit
MRIAALLVALFVVVVGIVGIVSPDSVTTVRRQYFATPVGLYAAGAVRIAMGLVLVLVARVSRAPKILRTLGALMCAQGLAATFLGLDRAQAILEWEVMHPRLLRAGAMVAVASGGFVALAVRKVERRILR